MISTPAIPARMVDTLDEQRRRRIRYLVRSGRHAEAAIEAEEEIRRAALQRAREQTAVNWPRERREE